MLTRCRLWAVALAGATLTCGNPAAASAIRTPIGKIASQRVISYHHSGGWYTPYDVSFLNEALWVALNVKPRGVHPRAQIRDEPDEWKDGIEEAWKNRLAVLDGAATAAVLASLDPIPLHLAGRLRELEEAGGGAARAIALGRDADFLVAAILVGVGMVNPRSRRRRHHSRGFQPR
jgi:hypothetical protein